MRRIYLLLPIALCLLALKPEELGKPRSDIAPLIEARNYVGAIEKLNSYVKTSPEMEKLAESYYLIGLIHNDYTHDYEKALTAYQKVIDLSKKAASAADLEPYLALSKISAAGIYRRTSQYENAIKVYREVAADYPGTEYAAVAVRDIKGIEDALAEIEFQQGVISRFPDTELAAEAQFEIAELYRSIENLYNPERAIQEYARLVERYPDSRKAAEAQFKIGYMYSRKLHKPEEAIAAYQKLMQNRLSANRLAAEALFQIGVTYYNELRDYQKALDTFTTFLQHYPTYWKFPAGVYWQGMCYEQLGNYDSAINTYEMFAQLCPDENPGWLGDIERHGDENVKEHIQAKVKDLKDLAPKAKWAEAENFRSQGKYHEALVSYRELMGKYPDSEYFQKARILVDEVTDLAEIQICKATIDRKGVEAPASQYRIAEIYETKMHDYPRAVKEYEKVTKNYPNSYWAADALYKVGLIYSGLEAGGNREAKASVKPDYQKAIGKYQQLIKDYPDTSTAARAYYQMGEIYRIYLNDYKRALESYGKVVNGYPRRSFYVGKGYKDSLADEAQFRIGKIYYENLQDYNMALEAFTEFLNDFPDSCRKAAAYSFIAAIHEQRKDREAAASYTERIIDVIVESDVQSAFFVREALYNGDISQEAGLSGYELQREIIKQLRRKASQLRVRVAKSP